MIRERFTVAPGHGRKARHLHHLYVSICHAMTVTALKEYRQPSPCWGTIKRDFELWKMNNE